MKPWALVVQCVDRPRLLPVVLDVDSGAFVGALRAVDLDVALELNGNADALDVRTECDIDYTWPRVALAASLNYVCFLFALYQCGRVYVVRDGALAGVLDASDVDAAIRDHRRHRQDERQRGRPAIQRRAQQNSNPNAGGLMTAVV